jgi:ABC-type dipeptide/oligopeptide/nickel transport system ATPase component
MRCLGLVGEAGSGKAVTKLNEPPDKKWAQALEVQSFQSALVDMSLSKRVHELVCKAMDFKGPSGLVE